MTDSERLDWLTSDEWDEESIVLVRMSDGRWVVCFGNQPYEDGAHHDARTAIDAAMDAEGG